jgi:hypothetical protein
MALSFSLAISLSAHAEVKSAFFCLLRDLHKMFHTVAAFESDCIPGSDKSKGD